MARYSKYRIFNNSSEYYSFLRKKRHNVKNIRQYETPLMYHPTVSERASLITSTHIWKYGDRYYQLADQHTKEGSPNLD